MAKRINSDGKRTKQVASKPPPGVKLIRTLEGQWGTVHSVAFNPKDGTLASGGVGGLRL